MPRPGGVLSGTETRPPCAWLSTSFLALTRSLLISLSTFLYLTAQRPHACPGRCPSFRTQHELGRTGSLWTASEGFCGTRAGQTQWKMPGRVCAPPGLAPKGHAQEGASGEKVRFSEGVPTLSTCGRAGSLTTLQPAAPSPHSLSAYTCGDLPACTGGPHLPGRIEHPWRGTSWTCFP